MSSPCTCCSFVILLSLAVACGRSRPAETGALVDSPTAGWTSTTPRQALVIVRGNDGPSPGDVLRVGQVTRLVPRVVVPVRPGDVRVRAVNGVRLTWSSTKPEIASVDSVGRVAALRPGHAHIRAIAHAVDAAAAFATGAQDSMPFTIVPADPELERLRFSSVAGSVFSDGSYFCTTTVKGGILCGGHPITSHLVSDSLGTWFAQFKPSADDHYRSVHLGLRYACALTERGSTYCWGDNEYGQLGDGSNRPRAQLAPIADGPLFVKLGAGVDHVCGVTSTGSLYCWGSGLAGKLGPAPPDRCIGRLLDDHSIRDFEFPCSRRPHEIRLKDPVRDVAAGQQYTCALTTGAEVYCWGYVYNIEFESIYPKRVRTNGHRLKSLVGGSNHACGLASDGRAYCWGRNWYGQLGAEVDRRGSARFVAVAGSDRFAMLSLGAEHTCGVDAKGHASCWGRNRHGQLGFGLPLRDLYRPESVAGSLHFATVAAGGTHTCGITTGGSLYCWGFGLAFRLRPASFHEQPEPMLVAGGGD